MYYFAPSLHDTFYRKIKKENGLRPVFYTELRWLDEKSNEQRGGTVYRLQVIFFFYGNFYSLQ